MEEIFSEPLFDQSVPSQVWFAKLHCNLAFSYLLLIVNTKLAKYNYYLHYHSQWPTKRYSLLLV